MLQKRYIWIDWMKTMGMFFIISGHFFSVGHKYLYMFSVPLFFFISGVLFHKEESTIVFVKKCFYNLFLPMLLICSSIFVVRSIIQGTFSVNSIAEFVLGIALGKYSQLETCWFVYTLILLKVIFQFVERNIVKFCLLVIFLLYAYYLNSYVYPISRPVPNAVVNVCLAYPFFLMGSMINKSILSKIDLFNKKLYLYILLVIGFAGLLLFAYSNGVVFLFICSYGMLFLLFFAGSLSGILFVFALAKLIPYESAINKIISKGSIIILGYHTYLIALITHFIVERTILDYLFSLIILLLFVPIIRLCELHFPLIIGKYRA